MHYSHFFKKNAEFFHSENVWLTLPSLKDYFSKVKTLGCKLSTIPDSVFLENPHQISIGKNVLIEKGAYIKGPCILGEGSIIRHGAYIRENVVIGKHCIVGHGTEIKNTIFLDYAKAAHFAYIGDSILGSNVNIGAGAVCANFRFDGKNIRVECQDTGLSKLGAILGDHVSIGCNAVLSPGTMIGPHSIIWPCLHVSGVIKPNSIIKIDQEILK